MQWPVAGQFAIEVHFISLHFCIYLLIVISGGWRFVDDDAHCCSATAGGLVQLRRPRGYDGYCWCW